MIGVWLLRGVLLALGASFGAGDLAADFAGLDEADLVVVFGAALDVPGAFGAAVFGIFGDFGSAIFYT
jgi:hypothetical protein